RGDRQRVSLAIASCCESVGRHGGRHVQSNTAGGLSRWLAFDRHTHAHRGYPPYSHLPWRERALALAACRIAFLGRTAARGRPTCTIDRGQTGPVGAGG